MCAPAEPEGPPRGQSDEGVEACGSGRPSCPKQLPAIPAGLVVSTADPRDGWSQIGPKQPRLF